MHRLLHTIFSQLASSVPVTYLTTKFSLVGAQYVSPPCKRTPSTIDRLVTCTHTHTHSCTCAHTHTHTCVCTHTHTHAHMRTHTVDTILKYITCYILAQITNLFAIVACDHMFLMFYSYRTGLESVISHVAGLHCLIAMEIVDWLLEYVGGIESRQQAVKFAQVRCTTNTDIYMHAHTACNIHSNTINTHKILFTRLCWTVD